MSILSCDIDVYSLVNQIEFCLDSIIKDKSTLAIIPALEVKEHRNKIRELHQLYDREVIAYTITQDKHDCNAFTRIIVDTYNKKLDAEHTLVIARGNKDGRDVVKCSMWRNDYPESTIVVSADFVRFTRRDMWGRY